MWSYLIQLVFMIFLPIMGRNGTATMVATVKYSTVMPIMMDSVESCQ